MGSYEDTQLWKMTLGPQSCDDHVSHEGRERLRLAYIKLRERTQHLAGEIHRYLPDFTVHDVTHSDALWYTADLVIGTQMTLTPAEAFVLGSAFLIHDLGMGLAAYVNGIDSLRETPGWKGFVAKLARDEGLLAEFIIKKDFLLKPDAKRDSHRPLSQEILERTKRRIEEHVKEKDPLPDILGWKGFVTKLARDEGLLAEFTIEKDFLLKPDAKKDLDQHSSQEMLERAKRRIEEKAIEQLLRKSHAKKAAELLTRSWEDRYSKTKTSYYLIEDSELRQTYGYLIGQIAYSHPWSISEIEHVFHRPKAIGAVPPPWQYPRNWTVEPLILSCLLRVADICHIDASRAPLFLRSIRNPTEPSGTHWVFQGHIQQPYLNGNRLTYTSGQPFPPEHQQAWWLCFDTLKLIDKHLRETDSLLSHLERRRLAARGVTGIEEPEFLANYIQTSDWLPLDTKLDVTNIPHLVKNLGGEALYGDEPQIPLRELIQNASDAIRARRLIKKDTDWGTIYVRLGKDFNEDADKEQDWIEVEDNGIGMSIAVLTGPFIDFGTSYWGSALMLEEFPDALAEFHSTGKYGIGFFSVFMWGEHVTVTTRRYDDGAKDTHVLEFKKGLAPRPILRMAREEERRDDGGTCIRVWLKTPIYETGGLLNSGYLSKLEHKHRQTFGPGRIKTLYDLCLFLCPCSYVNLQIQDQGQNQPIERLPRDQKQANKFIRELARRLSLNQSVNDKFSAMRIPGEVTENTKFVDIMRTVKHPSQEDGGFACIIPTEKAYTYSFRLNTLDLYVNKYIKEHFYNRIDEDAHTRINKDDKSLNTFTLANPVLRRFIVALQNLIDIKSRRRSYHSDLAYILQDAIMIFKMIILTKKIFNFCLLRFSDENKYRQALNKAQKLQENLTVEVQKVDIPLTFTPDKAALAKEIKEINPQIFQLKITNLLRFNILPEDINENPPDVLDLLLTDIIKTVHMSEKINILDIAKFSYAITEFLIHTDQNILNDTEIFIQEIRELIKENVYISLNSSIFDTIPTKELFQILAIMITDFYLSPNSDANTKKLLLFIHRVLHMLNIERFLGFLGIENIQALIAQQNEKVKEKFVQNEILYNIICNIIKETLSYFHDSGTSLNKLDVKYIYEITQEFDNTPDKEDSLFQNYLNFLKLPLTPDNIDYAIITTAGLRVTNAPMRFFGNLEGEVNKAARDSAFVDERVLSNWSTQQAKEFLEKSTDKAFLCAVAQMVKACGGDVEELPIAYTMDGWKTKKDISHDCTRTKSVRLIPSLPEGEFLGLASWESELQEQVLITIMIYPDKLLFDTKQPKYYYSLYHAVIEALAEGWNVPIEYLIEQAYPLSEEDFGSKGKQVKVEIGTKTYRDDTEEAQKSEPWYAQGYVIKNPKSTS